MKTKILFLAAFFTLSLAVTAKNNAHSVGEVEAAKSEMHNAISQSIKNMSVNEEMDGLVAEIYLQVLDNETINFYHVKCCNKNVASKIKSFLQRQSFVTHELLIGEKYKLNVQFKYVEL